MNTSLRLNNTAIIGTYQYMHYFETRYYQVVDALAELFDRLGGTVPGADDSFGEVFKLRARVHFISALVQINKIALDRAPTSTRPSSDDIQVAGTVVTAIPAADSPNWNPTFWLVRRGFAGDILSLSPSTRRLRYRHRRCRACWGARS